MGLRESLKRRVIGIVDKEQRDAIREENQQRANNRTVDRYERENALQQENLTERVERRKMIRGEEPLSIKKYAKSRAREAKNNAKLGISRTFNRDNLKESAVSGAKAVGRGVVKGGAYAGTKLAEASVQSYSSGGSRSHSGRKQRTGTSIAEELGFFASAGPAVKKTKAVRNQVNNDPFSLGDARAIYGGDFGGVYGHTVAHPARKKGKKARQQREEPSGFFGSGGLDTSVFTSDFSHIYGHSSSGKKKKSKSGNPFDIDMSAFGF